MLNSQLPAKWLKPFATDDANKVEIPLTTGDATRASQSLGFPPLTMQPPESGGVPPQGEDFNGAMNQVARIVWWLMAGGGIPFDSTWSANAAINGYPQGASITSADLLGEWFSTVDNNLVNPDTVGTGWVPGYSYGATAITGLTNANVTLTPAQAAKNIIRLSGTLTGNIQIIFPVWQKEWVIVNITTGAFTVTCKTAAGTGVVVSQTGGMQIVMGDSVNLFALGGNSALPLVVGPATSSTQAIQATQIQKAALTFGVDTGTANTYTVPFTPAVTALSDGMQLQFKAKFSNTGASTLNVNGLGATVLVGLGIGGLQGGEIVANGLCQVVYSATLGAWVLLECTGGALQIGAPTQSLHALQLAQFLGANQSLGAAGYQKLPGGLILQWGTTTAVGPGSNNPYTFPINFPTAAFAMNATYINFSADAATGSAVAPQIRALSASGFTIRNLQSAGNSQFNWLAWGN